jgi:hypothetical protein
MTTPEIVEALIRRALENATPSREIRQKMCGHWELSSPDAGSVFACVTGEWLQLETPPTGSTPPLVALEQNRVLAGLAKYAWTATADGLQLRAELPMNSDGDLALRVRDTLAGIVQGIAPPVMLEAGALTELCDATGWPFVVCHPHKMAVDLGLRDVFARARVEQSAETGTVRVSAELEVVPAPMTDVCGDALAVFLLRTAAVVRLVRPVIERRQAHCAIGFEAQYATRPGPRELAHALAALRVAAEMTSREVAVLARDATIARAYLAMNDMKSRVDSSGPTTTASVTLGKGEA